MPATVFATDNTISAAVPVKLAILRSDPELETLLRRCAGADGAALREIYDREAPFLLGIALRILRDRRLAEEALQDAFVQIWRHANRYQSSLGSARAWMTGIVRYRALDLRAAEARRMAPGGLEIADAEATGAVGGVAPVDGAETDALRRCLEELKDGPRHSIVLAYVEGYSHAEIAQRLSTPLGTVKSWILRGLAALKGCLER